MSLTKAECETIISIAADESEWSVFSSIPKHQRKLDKLFGPVESVDGGKRYKLPAKCVSFRKIKKMSDEQKKSAGDRMRKGRVKP